MPWAYVISDLNGKVVGTFSKKKNCKKTNQKEFRVEKVIEQAINHMLSGKDTIILLTVEYFPKPKSLWENVKVELDLSICLLKLQRVLHKILLKKLT